MKVDALGIARIVVKAIAMVVGGLASLVCLMSAVGAVVGNGWVRLIVALVVLIGVPAFLSDRLLPDDDPTRARGLPGDVFALTWMGVALVYAVGAHGVTSKLLAAEGDRLAEAGWGRTARGAYLLGGLEPKLPEAVASPISAEASASASVQALPPASESATPQASASGAPATSGSAKAEAAPEKDDEEKTYTPAELFKQLAPSVVTIQVLQRGNPAGGGTGFLIDADGTIATNHHVIAAGDAVAVRFMGGVVYEDVELLLDDGAVDLALLRVKLAEPSEGKAPDVKPVTLGDSDDIVVGERAVSIGNPLGLEHTLTDGLISARRVYQGKNWIQMSVPVSPGNSGGPLFNVKGRVVGVTTAQVGAGPFGRAQNLNLAVPINELKKRISDSYPGRRKFGAAAGSSTW